MRAIRRSIFGLCGAMLLTSFSSFAIAQGDWPTRPIRIVSPYAAGGPSDAAARIIAEFIGPKLGQPFVVENKPGAGTRIANEMVARSAPDGYTLLFAATPYVTAEALYGKLSYDPRKDLQPISLAVTGPVFLIVNANSPIKNLQEFIAYGKAKKEGITFASPAAGSVPHLVAELLLKETGVNGLNVHFRGDAPAYLELLAGRVDATMTSISSALQHIQSGKLRVVGVASPTRSSIYPQAPTLAEQGFPSVSGFGWYGFMAPANTPHAITARLQAAINEALVDPGVKQKLLAQGMDSQGTSAADFGKFIEGETRKWAEVIQKANIKVE